MPVGELKFITSSFQVITNESLDAQIWDVVKEFGEDLLKANFFSFVRAHILNPGNGYNSGVCGAKPQAAGPNRPRQELLARYLLFA